MSAPAIVVLTLYYGALGGLAIYGLHRLVLAGIFLRRRIVPTPGQPADLPSVTVQLPVFNEIYVLDRLVEAACGLDWPRDRLEIQILDDSSDATTGRARELAAAWRARGVDIVCLHREEREGFKSGALTAGLRCARGAFLAVFDADFVPPADFLRRTVPHFVDPRVGMVQARWGHLNREFSALTRAQALLLDGHFVVEQSARASSGRFFNFNGTAGVFRRACIEDAGGWQADTLTEDLDLSYRAQLAGWRFVFVEEPVCPAELPVELNALRSQQHRWAKGSIQTARKILPGLLRAPLPLRVKSEAVLHLTNNAAYLLLFAASLLLIPSLWARRGGGWGFAIPDLAVFAAGTGSFGVFCLLSQSLRRRGWLRGSAELPLVMVLGAGLALNNALAVVEAMAGIPSDFRRTPKLRIESAPRRGRGRWQELSYHGDPTRLAAFEAALSILFLAGIRWAWDEALWPSIPFLALFAAGYGAVALITVAQGIGVRRRRGAERPAAAAQAG